MSGCGRRHRAKHLTQQYLDDTAWQGPAPGECLGVCLGTPQGQHVRVLLLTPPPQPGAGAALAVSRDDTHGSACDSANVAVPHDCSNSVACTATSAPTATAAVGAPLSGEEELREVLAWLPGKFRKVIWLSVKDVVVLAQGMTVQCKPSPAQLQRFMRDASHTAWAERIRRAQECAETRRRAVERLPTHIHMTSTTTSVLPQPSSAHASSSSGSGSGGQQQPHDSGGTATGTTHHHAVDDGDDSGEEGLHMINRNRNNIRHQQQFFCFGADGHSSDDDDEEDEDD